MLGFITILKSPQKDMGCDITDYTAIEEICGTLEHVDNLFEKREMKFMVDLVMNHTSDEVCSPVYHLDITPSRLKAAASSAT